jgi:hypothetical protein
MEGKCAQIAHVYKWSKNERHRKKGPSHVRAGYFGQCCLEWLRTGEVDGCRKQDTAWFAEEFNVREERDTQDTLGNVVLSS